MITEIINGQTQNFAAMYENQLYSWRYKIANKKISLINLNATICDSLTFECDIFDNDNEEWLYSLINSFNNMLLKTLGTTYAEAVNKEICCKCEGIFSNKALSYYEDDLLCSECYTECLDLEGDAQDEYETDQWIARCCC